MIDDFVVCLLLFCATDFLSLSHKAHVKPRKGCAEPCAITHKPRKTHTAPRTHENFFLPHLQCLTKSLYHSVSLFITLRKCQKRIAYLCVVKRWQRGLSPASLRRGACRHRANCSTPIQKRDEDEAVRWCHPEWKRTFRSTAVGKGNESVGGLVLT